MRGWKLFYYKNASSWLDRIHFTWLEHDEPDIVVVQHLRTYEEARQKLRILDALTRATPRV